MHNAFKDYIAKFNRVDQEYYVQDIPNSQAEGWLAQNIPMIDIPDKTIEEIYYFRWWTFRKHIKSTEDGYVITEFLPPVSWAGKHNTIIAATGFHLSEGKWLKCGKKILEEYAKFWLDEKSKTYLYSSWLIHAIYELCNHCNDFSFGIANLDLMVHYYKKMEEEHLASCGLFWSYDNNDAMEYSISGCAPPVVFKGKKGLRPTLNSYMAANARAISEIAKKAGREELTEEYAKKYRDIQEKMTEILWDGSFYKAIHIDDFITPTTDKIPAEQNVKELIGYIPWCFQLPPNGLEEAFLELKNPDGFATPYGWTTAEQRHPRYLYESEHECLWNGYIWPFATSQTLDAMKNLLENYNQKVIDSQDFYQALHTYAKSQYRITSAGKKICWIDEVKHPESNDWSSRTLLKTWGWKNEKGGKERGKDYNHSTFCDIVLGGLFGIKAENGEVLVSPHIPEEWEYFSVDNLWIAGKCYRVFYDKTGERYGQGKGVHISEANR